MIMFSLLFLFPVPLSFYPSLSFVCTISLALLTLAVCLHQDWECIKQTLLHVHTKSSPPSTTPHTTHPHTHTHTVITSTPKTHTHTHTHTTHTHTHTHTLDSHPYPVPLSSTA